MSGSKKIILSAVLAFNFFQGMFPKPQLLLNFLCRRLFGTENCLFVCLGQGSTASHGSGYGKGWVLITSMKVDIFPSLSDTASNFNKCIFVCLLACF